MNIFIIWPVERLEQLAYTPFSGQIDHSRALVGGGSIRRRSFAVLYQNYVKVLKSTIGQIRASAEWSRSAESEVFPEIIPKHRIALMAMERSFLTKVFQRSYIKPNEFVCSQVVLSTHFKFFKHKLFLPITNLYFTTQPKLKLKIYNCINRTKIRL